MVARAHLVWSSKTEAKPTTNTGILRSQLNTMATEETAVEPPIQFCNRTWDSFKFSSTSGDECVMPQSVHFSPTTSVINDSPWFAINDETYEGMLPSTALSTATGAWRAGSPGLSYLSDVPSSLSFDAPSPEPCSGSFSPIVSHQGDSHESSHQPPQPRLGSDLAAVSILGSEVTASAPLTQSQPRLGSDLAAVSILGSEVTASAPLTQSQPRLGSDLTAVSVLGSEVTASAPLTQSSFQGMKVPAVNKCDNDSMGGSNSSAAAAVTDSSSEQEGQQFAEAVLADPYKFDGSAPRSLSEQLQARVTKWAPQEAGQLSASSAEEIDSRGSSNVIESMNIFCRDSETEITQSTDPVEPLRKKGKVFDGKRKTATDRVRFKKSVKEHGGTPQEEIPQDKQQGLPLTRKRKSVIERIARTGLAGHKQKKSRLLPTLTEANGNIENAPSSSVSEVVTGKSDEEVTLNQAQELSTHQPMPHCSDDEFPADCRGHGQPPVIRQALVDGSNQVGALTDIAIQDQLGAMRLQDSTSFTTAGGQGALQPRDHSDGLVAGAWHCLEECGGGAVERASNAERGGVERASDADKLAPKDDDDDVDYISRTLGVDESLGKVEQMAQQDSDSSFSAPSSTGRSGCSYPINDSQRFCTGDNWFRRPPAPAQPQFPFRLMAASTRLLANYWSSDRCSAAESVPEGSSTKTAVDGVDVQDMHSEGSTAAAVPALESCHQMKDPQGAKTVVGSGVLLNDDNRNSGRPGLTTSQQRCETFQQETCDVETACGGILQPREGAEMNELRESGAVSPSSPRSRLTTLRNTAACEIPVIAKNPRKHPADMFVQNIGEWLQKASISTNEGISKPPGLITDVLPLARFQLGLSMTP